ncbi:DEAD/DEAH box helicase family protein [Agrococcus versicolor]|uniref:DEAD/DEAH box helicase family protein n=1 Tax=Agrococcus versicolor TaxID=501482 RepID=A0ABN3AWA0_9MICO
MELQFKVQPHQTAAVDAVVECFSGQPRLDGIEYQIDPGRSNRMAVDSGLRNAELALGRDQLLANITRVQQITPGLKRSTGLVASPAAPINLDVEMETGTGKTYVYIKTMMELYRRFGWSKFIVVVPSIAIREGVSTTFAATAAHFEEEYETKARHFVYNSRRLHEIESFSANPGVQVMIINAQAFNATGADARRINEELDEFQSRRPIDVIAANRPILIIDEPQRLGSDPKKPSKTLQSLAAFKALFALRYSATHRIDHDKVHRLDAVDAYRRKLVKRIEVRGISVRALAGSSAYLFVDGIEVGRGPDFPRARVELEVSSASGIGRQVRRVSRGTRLHDLSGGIEAYRDLIVIDVDAATATVTLSSGDEIAVGEISKDVTDDVKRVIQIREVIAAHLDKERRLFGQGIKVLSLFFIDTVARYRDYGRADTLGEYALAFEEEYQRAVSQLLGELALDDESRAYREYLESISARATHQGYFSVDKRSGTQVDGRIKKTGDEAGSSDDSDAYHLILRDKERLLSLAEPVRFVWSHSALREGWDNPNVFTIGMLKRSDSTTSRRQEIGRGLRIAVNQRGERTDAPGAVHDINVLTVVTDEAYASFVQGLQQEIASTLSARPRKAMPKYFEGQVVLDAARDEAKVISADESLQLRHWLAMHGFVDHLDQLTPAWMDRDLAGELPALPESLAAFAHQVIGLIDALVVDIPRPIDGRAATTIALNAANFERSEFQDLWKRISKRAIYRVEFDSNDLVDKAVASLDGSLKVPAMQYVVEEGVQAADLEAHDLTEGTGFAGHQSRLEHASLSAGSTVTYDLIGEVAAKTALTRRTCAQILRRIKPTTFALFRRNPERFITEASRLIDAAKADRVVQHIAYDLVDGALDSHIFAGGQTSVPLSSLGARLEKSVQDFVVTDSAVERHFLEALEASGEVVVYSKLPRAFSIPTPVGRYNPDWAIAFDRDRVRHVYFVAETKGSADAFDLRPVEQAKIDCAKRFFEDLARPEDPDAVRYDVVTDFESLLQQATGPV